MKILVTGSRQVQAEDRPIVEKALAEAVAGQEPPHLLVHGGAYGADLLAADVAAGWGWVVEEHLADWTAPCKSSCNHGGRRPNKAGDGDHCPAAGFHRNAAMVATKPDLVVAFYKRGAANKGTSNCVRLARRADLDVRRWVV